MSVRAKFYVSKTADIAWGPSTPTGEPNAVEVTMQAVFSDDPNSENGKFWAATPTGTITLQITNKNAFKHFVVGQNYYIDFTPASEVVTPTSTDTLTRGV